MSHVARITLLGVALLLIGPAAAWAQYPSELVGFNGPPFDDPATSQEMFRIPEWSGSTTIYILHNTPGSYDQNSASRASGFETEGEAAMNVILRWVTPSDPDAWIRLTTFDGPERPNPSLHTEGMVRFKITNKSELFNGDIGLCLGIRETDVAVPQLADGGTDGAIEWVGVDPKSNGITAGPDMIVDTLATGDDVQEYLVGTDIGPSGLDLPPGTAIISPGPNGDIDTTPTPDDELRYGYFIAADGTPTPIPAIVVQASPDAIAIEWDLTTGNVTMGGTPYTGAIVGFTGDGDLSTPNSRGTLEHLAITNLSGDPATLIDLHIDELQFEAPEADPIPRPTVAAPIYPGDPTVTVTDVSVDAELVTLKVDNGVDPNQTQDPAGAAEVTFTLPHNAVAGDAYRASQTIGGAESIDSEEVRVALPAPVIGLLPAAGDMTVRITQIDPVADSVTLYVDGDPQNTVNPGGAFTVDVSTLAALVMGQEVTAVQGLNGTDSDPSDVVLVTTDQITPVFCDHFDYNNQGEFDLVWIATSGDTQLELSDYWNATPGGGNAAYSSEVGENRSELITPFANTVGTDTVPIIWTLNFYDDASTYSFFRQYAELRSDLGAILALGKYNATPTGAGTHYSARVMGGGPNWIALDDPGAPGISAGWHTLTAAIKTATIDFYVDGILAKHNVSRTAGGNFNTGLLGSGLTSTGGGAWYDDYCVEVGALSFPTIAPQPPAPPTVMSPILPGDSSVWVTDIDPTASMVTLYRNGAPDPQNPGGATTFEFTIDPVASDGETFKATQTVGGLTSHDSATVTVGFPAPVFYKAPAEGDTEIRVMDLYPTAEFVTVTLNGTTDFTEPVPPGSSYVDVPVTGLVAGDTVIAYQSIGANDSSPADYETVTNNVASAVFDCEDFELYGSQGDMELVWTQGGSTPVALSTERNATCPSGLQSAKTPAGMSWMYRAIPQTTPTETDPVVLNVNIYDPIGVDPAGTVVQWVELSHFGGPGTWFLLHVGMLGWANTDNVHYDLRVNGSSGPDWVDLDEYDAPDRSIGWHNFTVVHKGTRIDVYVDGLLAKKNVTITAASIYARADVGSGNYASGADVWFDDFCVETGPVAFGCIAPQPPNKPAVQSPIEAGDQVVTITGVDQDVTNVSVYDEGPNLIGSYSGPIDPGGDVEVTLLRALVHLERITGEVTNVIGSESSDPLEVGKGNGDVLICIGIRETGDLGDLGTEGTTEGDIEWIGAASAVNGAPQGFAISPSASWQTLTFDPAGDVTGFTGDGTIDGTRGTLEHLAVAVNAASADRSTGPYRLYVDNVVNVEAGAGGTDFVLTDFEGYPLDGEVLFQEPGNSGSTDVHLVYPPDGSSTTDAYGNPGQSQFLTWFWVDTTDQRWARITTAAVANLPSPIIDLTKPIRMDVLLVAADPCADFLCGDCNCDDAVNGFDIDYFIEALNMTPGQWDNAYPDCDRTCVADANGDQAVNGFDIDGFIQVLNTGTCPRDE
ncbi:MAG: hypothetical protein KKB50_16880 [Planctomycetes bacterium]|nr:hypothetical protein [Planctomycetota bacterium]